MIPGITGGLFGGGPPSVISVWQSGASAGASGSTRTYSSVPVPAGTVGAIVLINGFDSTHDSGTTYTVTIGGVAQGLADVSTVDAFSDNQAMTTAIFGSHGGSLAGIAGTSVTVTVGFSLAQNLGIYTSILWIGKSLTLDDSDFDQTVATNQFTLNMSSTRPALFVACCLANMTTGTGQNFTSGGDLPNVIFTGPLTATSQLLYQAWAQVPQLLSSRVTTLTCSTAISRGSAGGAIYY